jgi:uncharacterized protein YodC (DUF2158 family)
MSEQAKGDWPLGAAVQLKGGGPAMTVVDVGRFTGLVYCRWVAAAGEPRVECFPADALTDRQYEGGLRSLPQPSTQRLQAAS